MIEVFKKKPDYEDMALDYGDGPHLSSFQKVMKKVIKKHAAHERMPALKLVGRKCHLHCKQYCMGFQLRSGTIEEITSFLLEE